VIRKIGLTGGIASGKSSVAELLAAELHCIHIDADGICRQLLEPQEEGWQQLTRILGSDYFGPDGIIIRPFLRQHLFTDDGLRLRINSVIHPLVRKQITAKMTQVTESDRTARILVEVPLLYEVGWENLFDTVIVVYADYEKCLKRLMKRDGIEQVTAAKELKSQLPLKEKVIKADHVINNSGTLSETERQVKHLANLLNSRSEPNSFE
jgi:dephospho-CoA kinase